MINSNLKYVIWFLVCIALQVLFFYRIQAVPYMHVYVYVLFLLILPFETPAYLLMFLALITGVTVDAFGNTLGMHASASVLLAFMRPGVLRLYSPRDGYEKNTSPSVSDYGFVWFLKYAFTLILVHHFVLHMIDAFGFYLFHFTLLRTFLSTLATVSVIILIQYLTIRRK